MLKGSRGNEVDGGGAGADTDAGIITTGSPGGAVPSYLERRAGCSPTNLDGPAYGIVV